MSIKILDETDIAQGLGNDPEKVLSQKATTAELEGLKETLVNHFDQNNLLNIPEVSATLKKGYYRGPDGYNEANPNYSVFELNVTSGTTYYFGSRVRFIFGNGQVLVDDDVEVIDNFTPNYDGTTVITFYNADIEKWAIKTTTDSVGNFYIPDLSVIVEDTKQLKEVAESSGLINDVQNMLNPESLIDGMILPDDTISTEGAYVLYKTTTRIAVEPNTRYVLRYEGDTLGRLVVMEFDESKQPVEVYRNDDNVNRMEFTTIGNTRFVQVSFQKEFNAMFALVKYADTFYPYGGVNLNLIEMYNKLKENTVDESNILKGKKYCACGDSFTVMGYTGTEGIPENEYIYQDGKYAGWGITYPFIIGLRNNMEVTNLAVGGMTMATHDGSTNVFSIDRYKQIPADADYITIKLGINDDNFQTPVGTIDDTDNATFYGAYNVVLEYILKNHPFAKVGIIVTNGSAKKYTDATIAIAKKWGIPYLDEVNDPNVPLLHRVDREGVSEEVKNIRLANFRVNETNTHPNTKAHYYEASFVEDFLRRL